MGMDTPSEDRLRRRVLVAVGAATIIVSALGVAYSLWTLLRFYTVTFSSLPRFHLYLYLAGVLFLSGYVLQAISGIQLIRRRPRWIIVLTVIILVEMILYMLMSSFSLLQCDHARSISTAWSILSMGLLPQLLILFPLWAPPLGLWATGFRLRWVLPGSAVALLLFIGLFTGTFQ